MRVLIATGGTAGHIEPALAVADALVADDPDVTITVMGTPRGLETTLVPDRGYELVTVPAVPLPRKPNKDLFSLPWRLRRAVHAARKIIIERRIDVVVGFGGYASLPAYLAARHRVPIVVHEANASAGLANKVGARYATTVIAATAGSGLKSATVLGNPVRSSISELDRAALRPAAREYFGLTPDVLTVLVTGGSQGAQRINESIRACAAEFADANVGVLHHYGRKNTIETVEQTPHYVTVDYIDRMDYAYAAADLLVARSGAMTVAEASVVGLPAIYVPLPHGNGEQRRNAAEQIAEGSALAIDNAEFTAQRVKADVIGLLGDSQQLATMTAAAQAGASHRYDRDIAQLVRDAAQRGETS